MRKTTLVAIAFLLALSVTWITSAQQKKSPLTKAELLTLLKQAPEHRSGQADLADEITERGLAFKLDEKTLDELRQAGAKGFLLDAIRRAGGLTTPTQSANPGTTPPVTEPGQEERPRLRDRDEAPREMTPEEREAALARLPLLEQARWHAMEFIDELPNFTVTEIVTRYERTPQSRDWKLVDTLEIELTYRVKEGEKARLVKINGKPTTTTFEKVDGSTSTGEFGMMLAGLFSPATQADFKEVRKEVYGGRPSTIFDFRVKKVNSRSTITDKGSGQEITPGYSGTVWIDNESKRTLRIEVSHDDIPASFPVSLAENSVDYQWVTIADEKYLLPVKAEVLMGRDSVRHYTRNVIELKNYHKFETDVIIK
jgi:hypothetical protein